MNRYIIPDEWLIIEDNFSEKNHLSSESIFSIGNGYMGQRANFEEAYSGKSLQGTYIGGIYYTDKTRVGWWKNGYPEYFAKVLNAPYWNGIDVRLNDEQLDLAKWKILSFRRILNMKSGILQREFTAENSQGNIIEVKTERFISMKRKEIAAIKYSVRLIKGSGTISFTSYIDGNVKNQDSNYNEDFWNILHAKSVGRKSFMLAETKKTAFKVAIMTCFEVSINDINIEPENIHNVKTPAYAGNRISLEVNEGDIVEFKKYVSLTNSLNVKDEYEPTTSLFLQKAVYAGYTELKSEHIYEWKQIWKESDIRIEGDTEAQQGIRFNIFQLKQTYTGEDSRLNIGPKGFTGEKYGGSTYWDTEAFCLPFYTVTSSHDIARNLLVYRYNHLQKAIENAEKLGFKNGAALYPMVTMNGEECHNEWEITFEEIHRNGAIAYAIYKYIKYTGDENYLNEYGLEVLIGISRFWSQRVNKSEHKDKYMILGVTGPNEYENNVNNNWYTNKLASWCLKYTLQAICKVENSDKDRLEEIFEKTNFDFSRETERWKDIIEKIYLPEHKELGIFLQQDGYMDKKQVLAEHLDPKERPINQHWSWDRILRSCFIKQADVLQGVYMFEDEYDNETIERNFDFYESRTLHESSLSACVHSVIASKISNTEKAYDLYLRTSRLDLDDYNKEVHEGLHITSMAGSWLSVVEGFGGLRVKDDMLYFSPSIPPQWRSYSFKVNFRGNILEVNIGHIDITINNIEGEKINVLINGREYPVEKNAKLQISYFLHSFDTELI